MYLLKVIVFNNDDNDGITDNCQMYALQDGDSTEPYQLFLGKDYANTFVKEAPDPDKPFEGQYIAANLQTTFVAVKITQ